MLGPVCQGFHLTYGTGLAGKDGLVPSLAATGCPDIGLIFSLIVDDVVGGTFGHLFAGACAASVPFKGGTFLVSNLLTQVTLFPGGTPGTGGAGDLALPVVLSDPALQGFDIYLQAGFAGIDAVLGVSLTNGLRLQGN